MKNTLGAQRPASTRKILWIAVAAIVLVAALATAAFSQAVGDNKNWYGMGSDNVMGMMPPSGMNDGGNGGGRMKAPPACPAASPITIVHSQAHHSFTYVSTKNGCVYTITRNGKAWLTVTYDSSAGTYRLTDPNGTGALLLELGIPPGQFPSSAHIKINPKTSKQ
jgi:hypothetical protein